MGTPGSNILNKARRLISSQTVQYFKDSGRTVNSVFQNVTQYAPAVPMKGSFQPVARDRYLQNGLEFDKSYWNLFVPADVIGIGRNVSGDQISFNGHLYQCQTTTPWYVIDGWVEVLCIDLGEIQV